tara:strand:+ start:212 stop:433 length:222 start_codon:yes stop_codon:yes gene_type:complete
MNNDWFKIFSSTELVQVEIIKNFLLSKNIPAVIMNNQDSSYLMFGTIDLYINLKNKNEAINLLKNSNYEGNLN